jgi:Bacterial SH3 domain
VTAYIKFIAHRAYCTPLRLAALAVFGTSTFALAEPVVLSGPALRAAVAGSTVEIDTPIGTKVPVKYGADNSVSGEAGSVAFFLGSAADTGRWWVAQDLLCHRWNIWFKAEKTCLKITRDGEKITWLRDDGDAGTATIMPKSTMVAARGLSNKKSTLGGPVGGPVDTLPAPAHVAAPAPLPQPVVEAAEEALVTEPVTEPVYEPAAHTPPASAAPVKVQATAKPIVKKIKQAALQTETLIAAPAAKPVVKQKVAQKSVKRSVARGVTEAPTFWVYGVAQDDVLNVRMGPSSEHDVVGAIPPAARGVRMAGVCDGMWCLVEFGGNRGWVNRSYLVYEIPEQVAAR